MAMNRRMKLALIAPFALLAMALFVALGGWIVRSLWNWLLPPLFNFPAVTFWQALGLLLLSRILFGGFGFRGGSGRRRMAARWESLTPEERQRFRDRMRERCGFDPPSVEAKGPGTT